MQAVLLLLTVIPGAAALGALLSALINVVQRRLGKQTNPQNE